MKTFVNLQGADERSEASDTFIKVKTACRNEPYLDCEQRKKILKKTENILIAHTEEICEAICEDFGNRSPYETKAYELIPIITGLRHARKNLKQWMNPQKRHVSLMFMGGKNRVIPQPKGVVGIIAPWNFPLLLVFSPLTSAIAAGNRVMIKMAAASQGVCKVLQKHFAEKIPEDVIAFLPDVTPDQFSSLPFDHLVFTGSSRVGRTIMRSASSNLTPVTLELGGKSPVILGPDFPVKTAAERILRGKLANSGQICVAPDYVLLPENRIDAFIEAARSIIPKWHRDIDSKDYTSIISSQAYNRLRNILDDARDRNAEIIPLMKGEQFNDEDRKIAPVILKNVTDDMEVMQNEIFGPFLPLLPYQTIDQALDYVNDRDSPLALYIFSNNKGLQNKAVRKTLSGGVTINDCSMHVVQHDIPFGGIGESGMGHYHGYEGFVEFSKLRPVFAQARKPFPIDPPYGKPLERIFSIVTRWQWLR